MRPAATPAEGPDPYGNPEAEPEWMRARWGRHLRSTEALGTPVNHVDIGSGEPALVFVHGLSGSWQNWLENVPHFASSRRVVALDLPGFGDSPMPPWEITMEAYGRLLAALCDALGVGECVVVGNSLGGFVAAEAVTRDQRRFEKLVLVSAAGISHATMRRRPAEALGRVAAATAPIGLTWQERALRRSRLRYLGFRQLVHRPLALRRELLWEQFHHGAAKPGFLPAFSALVGYDILDQLSEVEVQTLIVWGRNDRIVPVGDAAGYARRLRNSRTVIFADTGHMPQLERPVRFNRVLEGFIAEP